MISYIYYRLPILTVCAALPLQRPIFPGHSGLRALTKAMAATILTKKWIQTRHVTMLIKPSSRPSARQGHGRRQQDSCNTFETYALLYDIEQLLQVCLYC